MNKFWICLFVVSIFLAASVSAAENESFQGRTTRIVSEMAPEFAIPSDERIIISFRLIDESAAYARKYPFKGAVIVIDPNKLENISDMQLRGLLAHELAHIEVYVRMNWVTLAFYGLHYAFSDSFMREVERETDALVIRHGFGEELLDYREYRLESGSEEDILFIQNNYLSPEEIRYLL